MLLVFGSTFAFSFTKEYGFSNIFNPAEGSKSDSDLGDEGENVDHFKQGEIGGAGLTESSNDDDQSREASDLLGEYNGLFGFAGEICKDSVDNDGDGLIDSADDECVPPPMPSDQSAVTFEDR